jgi:hypothetical protein
LFTQQLTLLDDGSVEFSEFMDGGKDELVFEVVNDLHHSFELVFLRDFFVLHGEFVFNIVEQVISGLRTQLKCLIFESIGGFFDPLYSRL